MNGLVWGAIIALIALGLSLVFGLVEIINLAHGEFYMLGAISSVVVASHWGGFFAALVVCPIAVAIFGLVAEKLVLRRIERDPSATVIATFGLSMILQYAALWYFGGAPRRVPDPWGYLIPLGDNRYAAYRVLVAFISVICFVGFHLYLQRSRYGLWIRSVGQDSTLASALGIPVHRVFWIVFGLGSGFAALAGVLAAPIFGVEFRMGTDVLTLAFMAAIVGGLGNFRATFISGILIGLLESLLAIPLSPTVSRVSTLVLICVALTLRPEGFFTSRDRTA